MNLFDRIRSLPNELEDKIFFYLLPSAVPNQIKYFLKERRALLNKGGNSVNYNIPDYKFMLMRANQKKNIRYLSGPIKESFMTNVVHYNTNVKFNKTYLKKYLNKYCRN